MVVIYTRPIDGVIQGQDGTLLNDFSTPKHSLGWKSDGTAEPAADIGVEEGAKSPFKAILRHVLKRLMAENLIIVDTKFLLRDENFR